MTGFLNSIPEKKFELITEKKKMRPSIYYFQKDLDKIILEFHSKMSESERDQIYFRLHTFDRDDHVLVAINITGEDHFESENIDKVIEYIVNLANERIAGIFEMLEIHLYDPTNSREDPALIRTFTYRWR